MTTKEQQKFLEEYKKLPEELKESASSEETSSVISDISIKNDLDDSKIEGLVFFVRDVLMGKISLNNAEDELEKLGLNHEDFQELNRKIFFPVKSSLEGLTNKDVTKEPISPETPPEDEEREQLTVPEIKKGPEKDGPDSYRESIE